VGCRENRQQGDRCRSRKRCGRSHSTRPRQRRLLQGRLENQVRLRSYRRPRLPRDAERVGPGQNDAHGAGNVSVRGKLGPRLPGGRVAVRGRQSQHDCAASRWNDVQSVLPRGEVDIRRPAEREGEVSDVAAKGEPLAAAVQPGRAAEFGRDAVRDGDAGSVRGRRRRSVGCRRVSGAVRVKGASPCRGGSQRGWYGGCRCYGRYHDDEECRDTSGTGLPR